MTIHHDRFMERVCAPQGVRIVLDLSLKSEFKPWRTNVPRMVEFHGEVRGLRELCRARNLGYTTIAKRIDRGMSVEDALAIPVRNYLTGGRW